MDISSLAAVGDSITWGYPYGRSWTHLTEKRLNISIYNAGLNGDTLEGMFNRLDYEFKRSESRLAIVMGGTNDVYSGVSSMSLIDTSLKIEKRIHSLNGNLIWGVPAPILDVEFHNNLEPYREWIRQNARYFIPFDRAFYDKEILRKGLLPDGVHPSAEGYEKMAELAVSSLKTMGEA